MPTNDPKLRDEMLTDFLRWEKSQRDKGLTLERALTDLSESRREVQALRNEVADLHRISFRIAAERLVDLDRGERHGRRLDKLEHQMALVSNGVSNPVAAHVPDFHVDPMERTGNHNYEAIKKAQEKLEQEWREKAARERESSVWWKRKKWEWAVAAVGAFILLMLSTAVSACTAYFAAVKQFAPTASSAASQK